MDAANNYEGDAFDGLDRTLTELGLEPCSIYEAPDGSDFAALYVGEFKRALVFGQRTKNQEGRIEDRMAVLLSDVETRNIALLLQSQNEFYVAFRLSTNSLYLL